MSEQKIQLLEGFPSTSASPTDIWKVRMNSHEYIVKIFVIEAKKEFYEECLKGTLPSRELLSKLSDKLSKNIKSTSELLLREGSIYQRIEMDANDNNKIFFVPYLKTSVETTTSLLTIASTKVKNIKCLVYNVYKNILAMAGLTREREAIDFKSDPTEEDYEDAMDGLRTMTKYLSFGAIWTRYVSNVSLTSYIREKKLKIASPTIALLYYAVAYQASLGIAQNDLHWKNVLVDKTKHSFFLCYKDKLFKVHCAVPMIFDYDRGVVENENVAALERFRHGGNCPQFNKAIDITKTMCISLKFGFMPESLAQFIPPKLLSAMSVEDDSSCWLTVDNDSLLCKDDIKQINVDQVVSTVLETNFKYMNLNNLNLSHEWFRGEPKFVYFSKREKDIVERQLKSRVKSPSISPLSPSTPPLSPAQVLRSAPRAIPVQGRNPRSSQLQGRNPILRRAPRQSPQLQGRNPIRRGAPRRSPQQRASSSNDSWFN